jgi:hypothetical protein
MLSICREQPGISPCCETRAGLNALIRRRMMVRGDRSLVPFVHALAISKRPISREHSDKVLRGYV